VARVGVDENQGPVPCIYGPPVEESSDTTLQCFMELRNYGRMHGPFVLFVLFDLAWSIYIDLIPFEVPPHGSPVVGYYCKAKKLALFWLLVSCS